MRILLLGGTTEAGALARRLAEARLDAVYSYAGRTSAPAQQPLMQRVGGFGGAEGLAHYLQSERITHIVDATHPFAAQISRNAVAAARFAGVPLIGFERPAWQPRTGDNWTRVADMVAAAASLPHKQATVFLAIGRQLLPAFAGLDHRWVLRLVDAAPVPLAGAAVVVDRGPFTVSGDTALIRDHGVTHVVAKNAGGTGASAKLDAARAMGLPVVMVDRPAMPERLLAAHVEDVIGWLHDATPRGV